MDSKITPSYHSYLVSWDGYSVPMQNIVTPAIHVRPDSWLAYSFSGHGGVSAALWLTCADAAVDGMTGAVPGIVLGSVDVLKERTPGSDLPCWFSATTCTSYSVSQSRPLSTTYSLLWGMRISGFQSVPCFYRTEGGGTEATVENCETG